MNEGRSPGGRGMTAAEIERLRELLSRVVLHKEDANLPWNAIQASSSAYEIKALLAEPRYPWGDHTRGSFGNVASLLDSLAALEVRNQQLEDALRACQQYIPMQAAHMEHGPTSSIITSLASHVRVLLSPPARTPQPEEEKP